MPFREAPTVTKAAVIISVVAFVFNIIGFAAPYWVVVDLGLFGKFNSGLWMSCGRSCNTIEEASGNFAATRTFEAIGFLATLASIFFLILYTCVSKTSGSHFVAILTTLALFGACGCIMIGIIIYGSDADVDTLSWAFALSCIGGILFGVAGLLIVIRLCAWKTF